MLLIAKELLAYPICEYLLVLPPHEALCGTILEVKNNFYDAYNAPSARMGKPQVTLVKFFQYEMVEERIVHKLTLLTKNCKPLVIQLSNFGSFPSHTIYIQVTSKVAIQQLIKNIRQQTQSLLKLNKHNKPHFMMEPHITIARQLLPWQYEKAWQVYQHLPFTGRFIADHLLLLKKPSGTKTWQIANNFPLMSLPAGSHQSTLFFWQETKEG
jgi:2'-5' RNA ligase